MNTRSRLAAAVFSMLCAGCAQTEWSKPGIDAAGVSRDLDECREDALRHATPRGVPSQSPQGVGGVAGPMTNSPAGAANTRFIDEHENVRQCMVRRGYRLQPG